MIKYKPLFFVFLVFLVSATLIFIWENGTDAIWVKKFKNGQPYKTYKASDIQLRYPDWKSMEISKLIEGEKIRLAVTSGYGCSFVLNMEQVKGEDSLQDLYEDYLKSRELLLGSKIISKGIENNSAFSEEEIPGDGVFFKSFTRFYKTKLNNFYKIYVIGEREKFHSKCAPIAEGSFSSIILR
jgi:hypothetical protein